MARIVVQPLVGYIRVSKKKAETDTFRSPDIQQQAMEQWAKITYGESGHRWCGWFKDLDRSGVTVERPALAEAITCAEENGADIVVYDLSRYSRNVPEGLRGLSLLAEANIEVKSASEHFDSSTSEGELSLTLMLAVNQYQLKRYSENWKRLISQNKHRGAWHGAPPFGYRRAERSDFPKGDSLAGRIVPDEVHAPHVKEIFKRYNAGESRHKIGIYAHDQGWFNRLGNVGKILSNPAYAGFVVEREMEVARDANGDVRTDNHLRPLRRPKKDGEEIRIKGLHKPLVTMAAFEKAQARIASETRDRAPRSAKVRWSAVGRTKCGGCGRSLQYLDKSDKVPGDARYLICTNRFCEGRPGSVRVAEFEKIVARFMEALPLLITPRTDELIKRTRQETKDATRRRSELGRRLDKIRGERVTLTRQLLSGSWADGVTEDDLRVALDAVREEVEALEAELAGLPAPVETQTSPLLFIKDSAVTLAEVWPKMSMAQRSEAVELLGITFYIGKSRKYRDTLDGRVTARMPFDFGIFDVTEEAAADTKPKEQTRPPKGPRRRDGN